MTLLSQRDQPMSPRVIEEYPSLTVRIPTPDGTMYLNVCMDRDNKPVRVDVSIGKAGSAVQAWAGALSAVITLALGSGTDVYKIIETLSEILSDRVVYMGSRAIRSGPDGVSHGLVTYLKLLGEKPQEKLSNRYQGPSFGG